LASPAGDVQRVPQLASLVAAPLKSGSARVRRTTYVLQSIVLYLWNRYGRGN